MSIIEHAHDLTRPPVVVAELSANHNGSLGRALAIIEAAAEAGADAIKFQTYTADTMTIDCDSADFRIDDVASLWSGYTLYQLYQQAHTPWEWHQQLFAHARACGLEPFSTPFDTTAIALLLSLGSKCLKVASFENEDLPLLSSVGAAGLPVIISAGMTSSQSIANAVSALHSAGAPQIVVLKCCSAYPAPYQEMNLVQIPELAKQLGVVAGLSDHTLGICVPVAATALGARMIEKHLTLKRSDGGFDSAFSLEPAELREMVRAVRNTWEALGQRDFAHGKREESSRVFKRSIYVVCDLEPGELLTEQNIRVIRPGYGLPPRMLTEVLGRKASRKLVRGTALRLEDLE